MKDTVRILTTESEFQHECKMLDTVKQLEYLLKHSSVRIDDMHITKLEDIANAFEVIHGNN